MQLESKLFPNRNSLPAKLIVATCALSFGVGVAACSSNGPSHSNAPQSSDSMPRSTSDGATSTAGSAAATTPPTSRTVTGGASSMKPMTTPASSSGGRSGSTGVAGTAGNVGVMQTAGMGAGGQMAATAGAGAESGAPPPMDCTPATWQNKHMVPNPTVAAVAADAGKGKIFDQSDGLDENQYVMQEFFFSGTSPTAYTTRMVVKRPKDPAKFSGTVFVEWYNVSGGIDVGVIWANSSAYFMREGHVFVGVTAQKVGADKLHDIDADRYKPINHPGDQYAADIFSQAAVAIRMQTDALLGPCMPVQAVIAGGQSQSAAQMSSYLNSTHPKAEVYDGFDIHSGPEPASNNPGAPTLQIFTMSEGNGSLGDGPNLVEWEVAGATHNDEHIVDTAKAVAPIAGIDDATLKSLLDCANPLNNFPAFRIYNAAIDHLIRWVRKGEKPPAGMKFETNGGSLALDEHNNVLGGIRLQDIDVPIATYGLDNAPSDPTNLLGGLACGLGGETIPFKPDELSKLYPSHDDYVMKYTAAADKALAAGFELQVDHDDAIKQAQAAPIPK